MHLDLEQALGHAADLYNVFAPAHPEHAEVAEAIGRQIVIVQSMVEDLWGLAWGKLPETWEGWK